MHLIRLRSMCFLSPDDAGGAAPPIVPPRVEPPVRTEPAATREREVIREVVHASEDSPGVKARIDALSAAKKAAEDRIAELTTKAAEADALKAELATTRATHAQDIAFRDAKIIDEDDQEEIRDRYKRAKPGEDGKVPAFKEWLAAVVETRPKWATPYLPAVDEDAGAAFTPPRTEPRQEPGKVAPPVVNPSAGRTDTGGGPPQNGRRYTENAVARMSDAEVRANSRAILEELAAEGKIAPLRPKAGQAVAK